MTLPIFIKICGSAKWLPKMEEHDEISKVANFCNCWCLRIRSYDLKVFKDLYGKKKLLDGKLSQLIFL